MTSSALLHVPAGERRSPAWPGAPASGFCRTPDPAPAPGRVRAGQPRLASAGPGPDGPAAPGFAVRSATVGDLVILDVLSESRAAQAGSACPGGPRVLMYLVRHGTWRLTRPGRSDGAIAAPAGSFALWPAGPAPVLEADAGTAGTVLGLPAPAVGPAAGGQVVTGPARTAEARLLMTHARAVGDTAAGLSPAGAAIARDTLLQLVRAVLSQQPASTAPRPALALAQAAMQAADSRLADPALSPALLASQLHVSVRTLHRAFAAAGEPAGAYIRRRRLEQARTDLTAARGRANVAEVAARWQFADSSHLTRAFKKHYGQTPARFARSA